MQEGTWRSGRRTTHHRDGHSATVEAASVRQRLLSMGALLHQKRVWDKLGMCATGPDGDSTLAFLADPLGFLERATREHGGVVGLQLGGELVALVTDPAVAKFVMIDAASTFVKVQLGPVLWTTGFQSGAIWGW